MLVVIWNQWTNLFNQPCLQMWSTSCRNYSRRSCNFEPYSRIVQTVYFVAYCRSDIPTSGLCCLFNNKRFENGTYRNNASPTLYNKKHASFEEDLQLQLLCGKVAESSQVNKKFLADIPDEYSNNKRLFHLRF